MKQIKKPEITFAAPSPGWGEFYAVAMKNPRWRWWRLWEPRVLWIEIRVPHKMLAPGDTLSFPREMSITER